MAKTGNRYLRAACFRAALSGIGCNPIVREHDPRCRPGRRRRSSAAGAR
jgi:hypothetical protein